MANCRYTKEPCTKEAWIDGSSFALTCELYEGMCTEVEELIRAQSIEVIDRTERERGYDQDTGKA